MTHYVALTMVLATVFSAGEAGAQVAPAATAAVAGAMQMTGKILAIDTNGKIMRLESEKEVGSLSGVKQVMDVAITTNTVITKNGAKAKAEDLRFGEQVQVAYDVEQGKNVAKSISVQEAGALSEEEPSPEANAPEPPAQEPNRSATGAQTPLGEERF